MKFFLLAISLLSSAPTFADTPASNDTLDKIKARGFLRCGVNIGLSGFSIQDDKGQWSGFDVQFCRALSSAIFSTPDKVEYTGLSASERFSALKYDQIDVLYRNSTMTATRDTSLGISFAGINYYDGQGFLINKNKNVSSAYKLKDTTFCMTDGTSSLRNLENFLEANNLKQSTTILKFRSAKEVEKKLDDNICDATSSDQSQLYSQRISLKKPNDFLILPEIISKEPLGPAVKTGDSAWFAIVRWTLNAMIEAEFLGIDSKNAHTFKDSGGSIYRLLGTESDIGQSLGLEADWAYKVISQVGNYGEVFESTIGSQSKLGIARGLNAQWNDGGILYSSPF